MKIIGLTGGIGSGKSLVSKVFETLGIPVYNSDIEAKRLNNSSKIIHEGLIKKFGKDIYIEGLLDKKKLASYIFHNDDHLNYVNSLIHPVVKDHFKNWVSRQKSEFVIKETAILFEAGIYKDVHIVISVLAAKELRIQRIIKRENIHRKEIIARMNKQTDDTERKNLSDFLIENNQNSLLLPQILNICKSINKNYYLK